MTLVELNLIYLRLENPINQHPWHDTLLMEASEKVRIAFVADNPGSWLIHCHMLEHQMGGMITWLEVA